MGAMVVAFVTGTFAVSAPPSKGLAIAIATCIGLTFFLHVTYAVTRLISDFVERDRIGNNFIVRDRIGIYASSAIQSLRWLLRSAPRYLCEYNSFLF
ncbi:hypothetical protein M5689_005934 [Euphorbia peplus]|nr:hypothetical protein M5689_005934 [Euphorbia peplus]